MATFTITKDVNFVLGGFEFRLTKGPGSCPDDLLDEVQAIVGADYFTNVVYDRSVAGGLPGVVVEGDPPEVGQVLTATTPSSAEWATPAPPSSGSVATDAIWDAKGDIAVATGADTAVRLPIGSNGQVLTVDSGEPKWATPSGRTLPLTAVVDGEPVHVWDDVNSLIPVEA